MKIISLFLILLFSLFIFTKNSEAKVLPQAKAGRQTAAIKTGTGISVYPRLRADRKALIVNFASLQNAASVSYLLTYKTNVQEEGAMGTLNLALSNNSVELLFGTCSKNVCRYHSGITNMRLEVSYTAKSGKKYIKRFKIKV